MRLYAGCRIAPQKLSRLARTWGGQPQPAPLGRLHPHMCPGTRSQKKKKKKMHVTPAQLQTQIRDLRALLCFNYMRCNPSSGLPPAVPCRRVKATLLPGTQPSRATSTPDHGNRSTHRRGRRSGHQRCKASMGAAMAGAWRAGFIFFLLLDSWVASLP